MISMRSPISSKRTFNRPAGLLAGLGTPWNTVQAQGQLNAVTQGVPCPDNSDPYFDECDASASQQLDDVNISVCAGPQGSLDVSGVAGDLSLDLTNATQASKDSVTNHSGVPTAFGNYGAVAPGQCITGDVYFDVTSGAQWQSLNYAYRSADFQSQTVYVWTS